MEKGEYIPSFEIVTPNGHLMFAFHVVGRARLVVESVSGWARVEKRAAGESRGRDDWKK